MMLFFGNLAVSSIDCHLLCHTVTKRIGTIIHCWMLVGTSDGKEMHIPSEPEAKKMKSLKLTVSPKNCSCFYFPLSNNMTANIHDTVQLLTRLISVTWYKEGIMVFIGTYACCYCRI